MTDLVIMKDRQAVTSSLNVAENFEKRHDHVLRDIDGVEKDVPNFGEMFFETNEPDSYGRDRRVIYMNRDGFTILAMGFTGKKALQFKLKYIEAFNQMEKHIKENQMQLPSDPMEILKLTFAAQENTNKKVKEVENRVSNLEENTILSAGDYGYISRRINQRVAEVARGFGNITQEQRGKLHRDINSGVKAVTGVLTRTQLRQKHFKTVLEYINDWEPSTATKMQVRQMTLDLETA
ncbi:Rha family transcriptional regulator [Enterococcus hulanensis]|uniref:Rha family transcriptional regulator n=1 Tax=Enterococcus hulanensis TaxID=2559929 RepID=A0ABU3EX63_9ENTE|nr:Rha family transcriptional regulator [Enterococcus hulanensis]MDT2599445.1 Rha family transcriptional regulator [Enterococcus hulanensis]MDT2608852.1 Rha family transcriptional regulator [Enterococcus hulanensis]MDT2616607.1 Rha family transcriptional regulator [Enterococcus hulanensis]MDT2627353.1 Rha family transcriptional regulator [Enterococcus hulanensis]MDT2657219.1 Rha family transcriptional regulator [Enterococcus hulanensis]